MKLETAIFVAICLFLRIDCDECPDFCLCSKDENNESGIKWLTCNDFPQTIPENSTHLSINLQPIKIVSDEKFKIFSRLKYLSLRSLRIEQILDGTFDRFQRLEELDLSGNRLTEIGDGTFSCPNLEGLNLRSNFVSLISTDAFRQLKKLKRLNLSKNLIVRLPDFLPPLLVELDASDNSIDELPFVQNELTRLTRLDLCGNNFTTYETDNFRAPILGYLCLGDSVRTIDFDSFESGALHTFSVRSESISTESMVDVLFKTTNLESLILDRTIISSQTIFGLNLGNLRTLRLKKIRLLNTSENEMEKDNVYIFLLLSNLQTLELDDSPEISRILFSSEELLRQLSSLANLRLENVDLSQIPLWRMSFLKNLTTLSLSGHSLRCDCEMKSLVRLVESNSLIVAHPERIKCHSPPTLRGLSLFSVQVSRNLCTTINSSHVWNDSETTESDDSNRTERKNNDAPITLYHVIYALIALTCLLIIAFIVVIILLCKTRHKAKSRESHVVHRRRRYSLDVIPSSDRLVDFSTQIVTVPDDAKDDPRPYSTLTFHPKRETKTRGVETAAIEEF